jgi:hypothetical protein
LGGWIAAAVLSRADVFSPPFWLFAYLLLWGVILVICGAATELLHPEKGRPRRFTAVGLEEIALCVASFCVFWLLVGD